MAPPTKTKKKTKSKSEPSSSDPIPRPFKRASDSLEPFIKTLSKKHVYITHIDSHPRDFKRKIFIVPVVTNIATIALFVARMWYILPYYFKLITSVLGHPNETTFVPGESTWGQLAWEIGRRGFTILIDFLLFAYLYPEPLSFFFGAEHANPVFWRWSVGFRDKEIYVRRSTHWDTAILPKLFEDTTQTQTLLSLVAQATAPMRINDKTGYLTMSPAWALDWEAMVTATTLVDQKHLALDAFRTVVLLYHKGHGWLSLESPDAASPNPGEDERRRQVFAFRDALAAIGKEDLFFRWIEIVQFEASQPGGFGEERREAAARQIRELFAEGGVDFDEFWKESVGSDGLAGM